MFSGALLLAGSVVGQVNFDSKRSDLLVELLGEIKAAIHNGHYPDETAAYKTVSLRLGYCAITFQMSSENEKTKTELQAQYRDASNLLFRVGSAIYPGGDGMLSKDLKEFKRLPVRLRSDKKALFYFLRNCRDFLKPNMVASAVNELLL